MYTRIIRIALALLLISLAACGRSLAYSDLTGTWSASSGAAWIFASDTCSYTGELSGGVALRSVGTCQLSGSALTASFTRIETLNASGSITSTQNTPYTQTSTIAVNGTTLTDTFENQTLTYIKQ